MGTDYPPDRRESHPLNDPDVRAKVFADEELSKFEKFIRRVVANKKPIGKFLVGVASVLVTIAVSYDEKWLWVLTTALNSAGTGLWAGGSETLKPDSYDQLKNTMLKERGLM
jgi:hypothetical protein